MKKEEKYDAACLTNTADYSLNIGLKVNLATYIPIPIQAIEQ